MLKKCFVIIKAMFKYQNVNKIIKFERALSYGLTTVRRKYPIKVEIKNILI